MKTRADRAFDEYLVLRARSGDDEAFDRLVRRWTPRLLRHAARLTDSRQDALDVVQESWLGVARGVARLEDPGAFHAWVYSIVTRRSADHLRRAQRARRSDRAGAVRDHAMDEPRAASDEFDGALRAAVRALPTERRLAVTLFYVDALTVAEIAAALDEPIGTIKSRLRLAREELRAALIQHEGV